MKKNNILLSILLLVLFVPTVTFASWWNPFTWNIFKRNDPVPTPISTVMKNEDIKIDRNDPRTQGILKKAGIDINPKLSTPITLTALQFQDKYGILTDPDRYFEFVNGKNFSMQQLNQMNTLVNKRIRDIQTGSVDASLVAKKYGISYSPGDENAVNSPISKVYDPVISDINARILVQMDKSTGSSQFRGSVTCHESGNMIYCNDGSSIRRSGNLYYVNY